ncbi:MAG: Ldh family oxidoreductase [Clostridia bacterium]|jgi:LDH2 family malate/lactate/ureidoglycolate dehydrogenase|nr:Ldh family oxidoreductase [Clostridia bacterium]
MNSTANYPVENLHEFCVNVLSAAGVEKSAAEIISESMLLSDLRGVDSHGIVRLPAYLARIEGGVLDKDGPLEIEKESGAVALINANNNFGQLAGHKAMHLAIKKADYSGFGAVFVKNSNHFGMTAYYSMMALSYDRIGFAATNSSPAMNPYGTTVPLLGTNPLSLAIPADGELPIVLDMATSVVARGKIRYAALIDKKIPLGWAVDKDGLSTDDPRKALAGSLEAIGGVKGSALSLMIDLLCGVLTNTALTGEVKTLTDPSGPSLTGHLFCALNPSFISDTQQFKQNVDTVIRRIKSLPAVDNKPIFLPGEIEHNLTCQRKEEGIPLKPDVVSSLNQAALRYGLTELNNIKTIKKEAI